jgi:hypothetical protein
MNGPAMIAGVKSDESAMTMPTREGTTSNQSSLPSLSPSSSSTRNPLCVTPIDDLYSRHLRLICRNVWYNPESSIILPAPEAAGSGLK